MPGLFNLIYFRFRCIILCYEIYDCRVIVTFESHFFFLFIFCSLKIDFPFVEREKLQRQIGENPSFCNNQQGRNSSLSTANNFLFSPGVGCTIDLTAKSGNSVHFPLELHADGGATGDYVPTVGRWGSEWPS